MCNHDNINCRRRRTRTALAQEPRYQPSRTTGRALSSEIRFTREDLLNNPPFQFAGAEAMWDVLITSAVSSGGATLPASGDGAIQFEAGADFLVLDLDSDTTSAQRIALEANGLAGLLFGVDAGTTDVGVGRLISYTDEVGASVDYFVPGIPHFWDESELYILDVPYEYLRLDGNQSTATYPTFDAAKVTAMFGGALTAFGLTLESVNSFAPYEIVLSDADPGNAQTLEARIAQFQPFAGRLFFLRVLDGITTESQFPQHPDIDNEDYTYLKPGLFPNDSDAIFPAVVTNAGGPILVSRAAIGLM